MAPPKPSDWQRLSPNYLRMKLILIPVVWTLMFVAPAVVAFLFGPSWLGWAVVASAARAAAGLNPLLNLRLINAINTDALAESMAQSRGLEQTILNVIDRNGSFLRQRIGG